MKKKVIKIMKISSLIIGGILLIGMLFVQSCSSAKYSTKDIKMEKIEKSKRYNDGKFLNTKASPDWSITKVVPIIWDFIFTGNDRTPDISLPTQKVEINQITSAKEEELKVTWVGHSSQIINIDGRIVLTDPIYVNRTAFMGPPRFNGDVPLEFNDLPEIDIVVISHNHYDHFNSQTLEEIHNKVKQSVKKKKKKIIFHIH